MDVTNLGVIFKPASMGRYQAEVVSTQAGTLASGLGQTPQDALLAAAEQWAGKPQYPSQ